VAKTITVAARGHAGVDRNASARPDETPSVIQGDEKKTERPETEKTMRKAYQRGRARKNPDSKEKVRIVGQACVLQACKETK